MIAEDLMNYNLDTLLDMREEWQTEGRRLLGLAAKAEFAILTRMNAIGASVHASKEWEATIKPGVRTYNYSMSRLHDLDALLREGEWERLITVRRVEEVDKRFLNTLERRGGEVARIIAEATVTTEGQPRLSIKKLEPPSQTLTG